MEKKLTDKQDQKKPYQDLIQARKESKQKANPTAEKPFEWLNENSRKFLAAGYLGEGVSAEERIANIAKRAEDILQISGFADSFIITCRRAITHWHHLSGPTLGKNVACQSAVSALT